MNLGFLTPDAASSREARRALADGAPGRGGRRAVRVRDGLERRRRLRRAERRARAATPTVGCADVSHLAKLELQAEPESSRDLTQASGLALEPGWPAVRIGTKGRGGAG